MHCRIPRNDTRAGASPTGHASDQGLCRRERGTPHPGLKRAGVVKTPRLADGGEPRPLAMRPTRDFAGRRGTLHPGLRSTAVAKTPRLAIAGASATLSPASNPRCGTPPPWAPASPVGISPTSSPVVGISHLKDTGPSENVAERSPGAARPGTGWVDRLARRRSGGSVGPGVALLRGGPTPHAVVLACAGLPAGAGDGTGGAESERRAVVHPAPANAGGEHALGLPATGGGAAPGLLTCSCDGHRRLAPAHGSSIGL